MKMRARGQCLCAEGKKEKEGRNRSMIENESIHPHTVNPPPSNAFSCFFDERSEWGEGIGGCVGLRGNCQSADSLLEVLVATGTCSFSSPRLGLIHSSRLLWSVHLKDRGKCMMIASSFLVLLLELLTLSLWCVSQNHLLVC